MKMLVTGTTGQVGWELTRSLMPLGEVIAADRGRGDLSRPETIAPLVRDLRPDVIVNAAAYTAVDKAESEEDLATTVNGTSVGVLAEESRRCGALLVHYSTDYVFDGRKAEPYVENDAPNPINAYGRSKLAGEAAIQAVGCAHIILRTTWIYAARGRNFLRTVLRLAHERDELNIVADQFGAPTTARAIADITAHMVRQAQQTRTAGGTAYRDVYHVTADGATNWHEFAKTIVEGARQYGLLDPKRPLRLNPIGTSDYPLPAKRPVNSLLSNQKLRDRFGIAIPAWQRGLQCVLQEVSCCLNDAIVPQTGA